MAGCLYITVGISGSGKSRFADFFCEATDAIELNADNYRKELGKGVNDQDINKVVFEEIDKAMVMYLAGGYSVFISNTNLHAEKIKELAERFPFNDIKRGRMYEKICIYLRPQFLPQPDRGSTGTTYGIRCV